MICSGTTETEINERSDKLAQRMFGITGYSHKRIVPAGRNTLVPSDESPADLTVNEDDVIFLGLAFGSRAGIQKEWEG